MKPVINIDEIDVSQSPRFEPSGSAAERYMAKIGPISGRIGAQKLGYNITAVPPGKRGFPLHHHHGNEEMFFILQGTASCTSVKSTTRCGRATSSRARRADRRSRTRSSTRGPRSCAISR